MKISQYVAKFLSAADLKQRGPQLILIESVEEEDVGGSPKPVLRGIDPTHVIALNPTNITSLIDIFGSDDTSDWVDEMCVAYFDPNVVFNNRKVGGIRFRKPKPTAVKPVRSSKGGQAAGPNADGVDDSDIPF